MVAEMAQDIDFGSNFDNYSVCVQNLSKSYKKDTPVLQNVSMCVEKGFIYGLLGSSGCGKSTLLSCILNLKEWDAGEVFVFGERLKKGKEINAKNIGYMPQDLAMYDHLSVKEMIQYFSKLYGMSHTKFKERMNVMEDLIDLKGFRTRRIISLSGGQKRRVSMSLALLHSPKLLILDEPTVGLDPLLREKVWKYLFKLTLTAQTTIVITTHYIEEVKYANKVGIMRKGRILVEEDPAILMRKHNTLILEDVVRNICYSDVSQFHLTKKNSTLEKAAAVTFSNFKNRKIDCDPVNLRKFYRNGSIDVNVNPTPLSNLEGQGSQIDLIVPPKSEQVNPVCEDSIFASVRRSLEYSRITWINFTRNPMFVFIILFLPPFQIFTTGVVVGVMPKDTPVGVVNLEIPHWTSVCSNDTIGDRNMSMECDTSIFSCAYIRHLQKTDLVEPVEFLTTEEAYHAVEQGDIRGYVLIPNNFSQHLLDRALLRQYSDLDTIEGTLIKLKMDLSDTIFMFFLTTNIYDVYYDFIRELGAACNFNAKAIEIPFLYKTPVFGEMHGSVQDAQLPAGIAGLLFEIAFAVTPLVLVGDMKSGVLERSKTAGLKNIEWMIGLLLTMVSVAFFQAFLLYATLIYILNFTINAEIWFYVTFCLLSALLGGTLGLLAGVVFKNEMTVIICAVFLLPVLAGHVGLMRPMEFLPRYYRTIMHYCFPASALVHSFLSVLNRGLGLLSFRVWPGILITVGWSAAFSILSLIIMSRL